MDIEDDDPLYDSYWERALCQRGLTVFNILTGHLAATFENYCGGRLERAEERRG